VPELAYRFSTHDLPEMAHQFGLGLRRMMAGILPATAGYLLLAGPLIALLLRHRAFNSGNAEQTGQLLAFLAVGLPGYCLYLLCISALQAMRDTRTAFYLYLFENCANIILAFILTEHYGARGLSLSLSIAYSLAAIPALLVVRSRMGGLGGRAVGRFVARSLGLTLMMSIAVAIVAAAVASTSETGLLLRVGGGVLAGVLTYGAAAGLAGTVSGWQTARKQRLAAGRRAHGYDSSRH
jgi:putative peptidoglycan lipid II flippase